jgi:hypothetical protein
VLSLSPFFRSSWPKTQGPEIDGDSGMAPQAPEMAQNGLGNGVAGSRSLGTGIDQANSVLRCELGRLAARRSSAGWPAGKPRRDAARGLPRPWASACVTYLCTKYRIEFMDY